MARASLASAATVAALLTACGPDVAPAVPPEELTGAAWSLTDASGSTPVAGFPVTLRFDDDGSLHGSGGCNRLAGRFAVDGALLTIEDNLATTRRSCPEAVMTLEHNAAPTGGATRAPPGSAPPENQLINTTSRSAESPRRFVQVRGDVYGGACATPPWTIVLIGGGGWITRGGGDAASTLVTRR